ncbi:uncharacterized protein LOC115788694 [Archocentrus centrarchus]|uniref:uncharacterized protein LOC115788694 n=1 Tax=Archocentrus centrarchus TaxID=63155 RepID=UPI0011EA50F0|nr:uncharacterized protein LOC115788694 [Archocentrus centrarchus]
MKFVHDTNSFLLSLVILAELLVHSSPRPTPSPSLCSMFGSMMHHVEKLINSSKKLHDLTDNQLLNFVDVEHKLDGLPVIPHTAAHFRSLKVNESLSQLYVYTESFRLHAKWLKTVRENVSVPSQAAEGASINLKHLSDLIKASLDQISEEVPESAPPSLPVVSTAFDALRFSVEISEQLQVFCHWSKRVLRHLQRPSHCQRR